MKRIKFISFFFFICFCVSACSSNSGSGKNHEHTFDTSWTYDDDYHWHNANCGHDVVNEKGVHTFNDVVTPATFEAGGYTTHTCTVCGYSYVDSHTDQLVHHYESGWSHDESTHWHACTDSGYEQLKSGEAAHTFNDVVTDPTYSSGGYTTHTCTVCGYSYVDSHTDQLPITITWKNYDGTILEIDANVPYGTIPSYDSEAPIKEGNSKYNFIFSGWNPAIDIAVESTVYVAQFSSDPVIYRIEYELDGGTSSNPTSYSCESGDITLTDPVKNGYEFIGWTGSNGSIPQKDIEIDCNSETNYYFVANWNLITYSITYHLFGGVNSIKNPSEYTIEDSLNLNQASKDGYSFEGWFIDSNYDTKITNLLGHYGDLDLYAKFIAHTHNVELNPNNGYFGRHYISFDSNGHGTSLNPLMVDNSTNIVEYPTLSNDDRYLFLGWYLEPECVNFFDFANSQISENITLYAGWYKIPDDSYTVSGYNTTTKKYFCANLESLLTNGTRYTLSSSTYYYSQGSPSSSDHFGYYNYFAALKDTYIDATFTTFSGNEKTNFFIYDALTGEKALSVSNRNLDIPKTSQIQLKQGHVYYYQYFHTSKNYIKGSGNNSSTNYSYGAIYSNWDDTNLIPYTNIFSKEQNNRSFQYDENVMLPDANKEGYDFQGWYDADGNKIESGVWKYDYDLDLHAEYTLHDYTISYVLNGGINNISNPLNYNLNNDISLSDPTRDGYSFEGWFTDPTFNNRINSIHGTDCKDYTLYAKWIANTYSAFLDYNGGQNCPTVNFYSQGLLIKSIDLYKDSTLSYYIPEAPNSNLKFAGWYSDPTFNELYSFNGTVSFDLNLYAKWVDVSGYEFSELGNDVNVQINGNQYGYIAVVSPINQEVTITSSSELDLYGVVYDDDWNEVASCDDISDNNLDFSITITLQAGKVYYIGYKANQVSISGNCLLSITGANSSDSYITGEYTQIIESVTVTYDSSFSLPTPKKEGYAFIGWFDEAGNQIDTSSWNYTGNITIYAHWEKI